MEDLIFDNQQGNALALETELTWLSSVLDLRFRLYFAQDETGQTVWETSPPNVKKGRSAYEKFIIKNELSTSERIVLGLALAPAIRPQMLDIFFTKNSTFDRGFTEFGGIKGNQHGGFIPTVETALFVLAGNNIRERFEAQRIFESSSTLVSKGVIRVFPPTGEEPAASGQLSISKEFLNLFTTGKSEKPDYSAGFPARLITTDFTWDDLVVDEYVREEIDQIESWLKHEHTIMHEWGMSRVLKPGFRSLFYGPPGTGKTMTAGLIGKSAGLDVYRIDLSMMVSKYIGETEKNLANVFDQAQSKRWLLFFDEADALFSKRTNTSSSNDRYANQEVSYLLQRLEDFPGVVILASNLRSNIDEAFTRRFQSMISFSMPGPEERLLLWKMKLPARCKIEKILKLEDIAEQHQLSGGLITNVARYCSLKAVERGDLIIRKSDIETGIKKEFRKEGKILS